VDVESKVLERIRPSAEEEARLAEVVRSLRSKVESTLAARGWDAKPILVGSVAKGTHLTGTEVDMFVAFPPDLPREDLETRGLALGKLLERGVHMYAEHPYTRGWFGGFEVEIVPCYRILDSSQRMSAVDRTPFHADYVIGRLQEGQANQVRLLKAWTEGIGVYGAEAKVRGFSGYLCELLVLKFGTFRDVLAASLGWKRGEAIELDRPAAKPFADPLVVIDPIDGNRNVASAVSIDQLAGFVHAAREYLRAPSERYFFPRALKAMAVTKVRALAKRRGTDLILVSIRAPPVTEDVLYPQLRKAHLALRELLDRAGFQVHESSFDVAGREAIVLFELASATLPRVVRHGGPPVWVKNAKDFLGKWSENPRTLAGPFIVEDRWVVDVVRDETDAAEFVRASRKDLSLGKDLDRSARTTLKVYEGATAVAAKYAMAWTRLFDKTFPWQR